MSTLIAIVFHDESTAFEMRATLAKMQSRYLLEMEDAVVVTRDSQGKIAPGREPHGSRCGKWRLLGHVDWFAFL